MAVQKYPKSQKATTTPLNTKKITYQKKLKLFDFIIVKKRWRMIHAAWKNHQTAISRPNKPT